MSKSLPAGNVLSIPLGNLPFGIDGYAIGMDKYAIRRQRLEQVIKEIGSQAALAEKINRQPSYISRILSGDRNLGEDLAAEIETVLKKPTGWMSMPLDAADIPWPFGFDSSEWQALTPDERERLERTFKHMIHGAYQEIATSQKRRIASKGSKS